MSCYNSIVIDAPIEKVWTAFENFDDMSLFPNVISSLKKVGDVPGTQVGAKRILNDAFHETLKYINESEKTIRYSIDDGPGPMEADHCKGYIGEVQLFPVTANNGTFVLWTSTWEAGGNSVAEFCNPIYHALLGDLKASLS
jgi:carbon monoxide dehydrogenase subunit G